MEKFVAFNPTHLHFGKGVMDGLGDALQTYGQKVLFIYGKKSIHKNGLYNKVIDRLKLINAIVFEYHGIKSNPIDDDVNKAAKLGIEKGVDVVLAVGGGSVIDSAKIVSLCIAEKCDAWDVMKGKCKPTSVVPLVAVLTLAATGTEMNPYAVLQNHTTNEKIGYGNALIYPDHSFLDPTFSLSVPWNYTSYGIVDLIAHCLEAFFGEGEATLSDKFVAAIIKEAMEYGPLLMKDLKNYKLREKIMWAATTALNGWTNFGRKSGDWGVHDIGHTLSFLYDTPHGATLSIAYPAWLKLHLKRDPARIAELGYYLFGINSAPKTVKLIEKFFKDIQSPVKLSEIGLNEGYKTEITELMQKNRVNGINYKLFSEDYPVLVDLMF